MKRITESLTVAAIAGLAALAATTASAADLAKGREKAEQVCAACHGKDGNTPVDPSYPRLAGQHADYLYRALLGYKDESRKNAIMGAMAKPLTNDEMRDLAAYYASLPGQLLSKK
ncbi:MAG TPA: cytochrome c [Burkholderiaceae bacterium]